MTIQMEKVYSRMLDVYESEIEKSLKEGQEYLKISFDTFRIGMKSGSFINSKITAREKWENAIADGIIIPLGEKKNLGMLDVKELLIKTGLFSEYKYKYKFFSEAGQTIQEGSL